jgi:acetoin utilization deacetylase AcuC-like enzyme
MEKYRLLRERVMSHPDVMLEVPDAATSEALRRVHTSDYVDRVTSGSLSRDEIRRIGFPWSTELVERSRRSVGGTIAAASAALEDGASVNLAGGTHHAFPDRGEGFCVFNDVAVAVEEVRAKNLATRCAVLDLDVHQGNGTAEVFAEDESVFTLSVHGENNFPFRKTRSDLDVSLPDGTGDDQFVDAVGRGVHAALGRGVDLAFYVAGADPYEGDRLGRLMVTKQGLLQRDSIVFDACRREGVPVAVVMSGGYAHDVTDTVDIHEATVRAATLLAGPVTTRQATSDAE